MALGANQGTHIIFKELYDTENDNINSTNCCESHVPVHSEFRTFSTTNYYLDRVRTSFGALVANAGVQN